MLEAAWHIFSIICTIVFLLFLIEYASYNISEAELNGRTVCEFVYNEEVETPLGNIGEVTSITKYNGECFYRVHFEGVERADHFDEDELIHLN